MTETKESSSTWTNPIGSENCSEDVDHHSSAHPRQRAIDKFLKGMIVFSSFIIHFVVLGSQYSFGVVFSALVDDLGTDEGETAIVGSLATALMLGGGILTGPLARKYGCRITGMIGGIAVALGLLLSTYTDSLWHLYLSYGVIVGIGYAFSFVTAVIVIQQHFVTRRSLATGIAVSGSGIGTLVYAEMTQSLIAELGWRPTLRVLSAIALVGIVGSALFFQRPDASLYGTKPEESGSGNPDKDVTDEKITSMEETENRHVNGESGLKSTTDDLRTTQTYDTDSTSREYDTHEHTENHEQMRGGATEIKGSSTALGENSEENMTETKENKGSRCKKLFQVLQNPPLRRIVILASIMGGPYFVPIVHLERFATRELNFSSSDGAMLVAIFGITSTVGRLLIGLFTDKSLKIRVYMFIVCVLITASFTALMPAARDMASLSFVTAVFGMCAGSFIAVMPVVAADCVSAKELPLAMGFVYGCQALSVAVGPPIAGWIFVATGSYTTPFVLAGGVGFTATLILFYPLYPLILSYGSAAVATQKNVEQDLPSILEKKRRKISKAIHLPILKKKRVLQ